LGHPAPPKNAFYPCQSSPQMNFELPVKAWFAVYCHSEVTPPKPPSLPTCKEVLLLFLMTAFRASPRATAEGNRNVQWCEFVFFRPLSPLDYYISSPFLEILTPRAPLNFFFARYFDTTAPFQPLADAYHHSQNRAVAPRSQSPVGGLSWVFHFFEPFSLVGNL